MKSISLSRRAAPFGSHRGSPIPTLSEKVNLGLRDLGLELISPLDNASRSGNTCFLSEDARSVSAGLAERKILVWGEYGRVRVSTHLYNNGDDGIRLINGLSEMCLS